MNHHSCKSPMAEHVRTHRPTEWTNERTTERSTDRDTPWVETFSIMWPADTIKIMIFPILMAHWTCKLPNCNTATTDFLCFTSSYMVHRDIVNIVLIMTNISASEAWLILRQSKVVATLQSVANSHTAVFVTLTIFMIFLKLTTQSRETGTEWTTFCTFFKKFF